MHPPPHLGPGNNNDIDVSPLQSSDKCPALRGPFKRRTPGNGLSPSTRAQEYAQSLIYPKHCRHWQESLYAIAITGPFRPWLLYSNTDWTYPKFVSRLNCFRCHTNRKCVFSSKALTGCILLLFWLWQNLQLYCGRTERQTDRQRLEGRRYSIFVSAIEK